MPKITDHQRYREELLLRSFPLFAEHGYDGLTTRMLAKGLDVSTGTLYHYFPNKEALFEQMIEHLMKQDLEEMRSFQVNRTPQQHMAELARMFQRNREPLTMQAILCFDFCRHLQRQGLQPREFWQRIQPQYEELSEAMFGKNEAIHEFIDTLIKGILLRLAWDDPEQPDVEQIFSTLSLLISKAFPQGGSVES